jgi:hypothetical protein
MAASDGSQGKLVSLRLELKKLSAEQVKTIDEMLVSVGEYGEVRLVVQHGELRYINRLESFKVWKNDTKS